MALEVFLLCLLLLDLSTGSVRENERIDVNIYANTLFEIDGISSVPSVFGITAYSDSSDFATSSGSRFLSKHNIDTVGIGSTTLNLILPTNQYSGHSISSLQKWFSSGYAYHKYRKTPDYYALRSRKIRKGGARPFLFLRNIMGTCDPYCQRVNCLSKGGTPKSSNGGSNSGNNFSWWSTLITGYLKLALKADPDINTVHIWNEPDTTFWKDRKNGSYYAELYLSSASSIKSNWPNLKIGGPVSSAPSTSESSLKTRYNKLLLWHEYIQPLIDSAVPKELIDFIDFHAFNDNALPETLLNAIETTVSYALVKYRTYLPIAVTEHSIQSNYHYDQPSTVKEYYLNRTLPLMISTFALLRSPDKVIHRLLFDYKGASKCRGCSFYGGSPESSMYQLLGKLVNGSRLHLTIDGGQYMTSSCSCYSSSALGGQPVIGEAAFIHTNITFALLNTCNCPLTIKLSLIGTPNSAIRYSWAAMQDYTGTRTVSPLPWSSSTQSLTLSSYTLFVSSYQFSTRYSCNPSLSPSPPLPPLSSYPYSRLQASPFVFFKSKSLYHRHRHSGKRFPVRLEYVQQAITAYPTATKYIMMTIPSPVPCNYMFTVQYMVEHAMDYQPVDVRLRIGFIGHPGSVNWSSTWKCRSNSYYGSRKWLQIVSPGLYYEQSLGCPPKVRYNGSVKLHFKALSNCVSHSSANSSHSSSSVGYLAFSSIVYISRPTLY